MKPRPASGWRRHGRRLAGVAVGLVLLGLFHIEENWRGERAWENCKRTMRARGVEPDWSHYIPAAVPDDQNIFGVPEMQRWFQDSGGGWADLAAKLPSQSYPGWGIGSNTT